MRRSFTLIVEVERENDEEFASDIEGLQSFVNMLNCCTTYEARLVELSVVGALFDVKELQT